MRVHTFSQIELCFWSREGLEERQEPSQPFQTQLGIMGAWAYGAWSLPTLSSRQTLPSPFFAWLDVKWDTWLFSYTSLNEHSLWVHVEVRNSYLFRVFCTCIVAESVLWLLSQNSNTQGSFISKVHMEINWPWFLKRREGLDQEPIEKCSVNI